MSPRILYIADVPVESTYHGSALVYRLLELYPVDKLFVVEGGLLESGKGRRLPSVRYDRLLLGGVRFLQTRLHSIATMFLIWSAQRQSDRVDKVIGDFEPEAVLTVAHGFSWLSAAAYARKRKIPLHLIIHDDWPSITSIPRLFRKLLHPILSRIYGEASSRLCVSPQMVAEYQRRYGVIGTLLYPSRAIDCRVPEDDMKGRDRAGLVVAFAGSINSRGYALLLGILADELERRHGTLLIFGPHRHVNASNTNVRHLGLLNSCELIVRLRKEADILFVPMSFDQDVRDENMRLSFPSKLTDYTATGLPILICGPPDCSAVCWARDYSPVAEVVTSQDPEAIGAGLDRLLLRSRRVELGHRSIEVGAMLFSHSAVQRIFRAALHRGGQATRQVVLM